MELTDCFKRGLLVKTIADVDSARRSLTLAQRYLADADKNLAIESYRIVIVTSYAGMFHAARAVLYRDGIKERSHECIPLYIREKYPALAAQASMLDSYRKYRHEAIYGLDFNARKQDAITALAVANSFLSAIEKELGGL